MPDPTRRGSEQEMRRQEFIWLGNQLFERLERTQHSLAVVLATTRGWMDQGCPPEASSHVRAALDRAEGEAVSPVAFTSHAEIAGYLDSAIRHWRAVRDGAAESRTSFTAAEMAPQYIDAFQSMRSSLLGKMLP